VLISIYPLYGKVLSIYNITNMHFYINILSRVKWL
jgi:hypothetical protein